MVILKSLKVGELFSFKPKGPVYMISQMRLGFIEFKSYSDGKIRITTELERVVYIRKDYDLRFDIKWFKDIN